MINLFALEYPNHIQKKESPNGVKILCDTLTNTYFTTDKKGLFEFRDTKNNTFCFTDGTYTINGNKQVVIRKGEYCILGGQFFIIMTHTKEEVLARAFNYFAPLAHQNIENFFLREGEIFLN
jgi:hypothetical protein